MDFSITSEALQAFDVVFLPLVASGCHPVANLHFGLKAPDSLNLSATGVDRRCPIPLAARMAYSAGQPLRRMQMDRFSR